MDSPDSQAKYQKLATEYAKLRAQNQVLRKAVVDEQAKNVQLSDSLKVKDQSSRKFEQEIDSLKFRNQQLSKRLTVLQDDLDQLENKGNKKGKNRQDINHDPAVMDNNVFSEELKAKILENEKLHARIAEDEATNRSLIYNLESNNEHLKKLLSQSTDQLNTVQKKSKKQVNELLEEKNQQEILNQQRDLQLIQVQEELDALKISTQTSPRVDRTTSTTQLLEPKTSISNSSTMLFGDQKQSTSTLIGGFEEPIRIFCDNMVVFLSSYLDSLNSEDHNTIGVTFVSDLKSSLKSWKDLSSSYEELHRTVANSTESSIPVESLPLNPICKAASHCTSCLRKFLPILNQNNENKNSPRRVAVSRLVSCWGSLDPCIASLGNQSNPNKSLHSSAQGKVMTLLSERLAQLHSALGEVGASWGGFVTQQTSDDHTKTCHALVALTDAAHLIHTKVRDEVVILWTQGITSAQSTPSSISSHMKFSASNEDIPSGGDAITRQLSIAATKLSQLEAEKEHWKLEYQLMQHKQLKESQRLKQVAEELKKVKQNTDTASDCSSISSGTSNLEPDDKTSDTNIHNTSILGEASSNGKLRSVDREDEIRQYMTGRCSKLYLQVTAASSQAALFQNECEVLMRRLVLSEERRSIADQELDEHRNNIGQLKETLQITSRNYEEQISTMSMHLADLNEKIMSQAEHVERLKFELKNKKSKK